MESASFNHDLTVWIEKTASDFMLLDRTDLPGLAKFFKSLKQQAEACAKEEQHAFAQEISQTLGSAATALQDIILDKRKDFDEVMQQINDALEAVAKASSSTTKTKEADPQKTQRPEWVDDTIINAYIEQQLATLPDMEQMVLAYEQNQDPDTLDALKRSLHTIKGESGVIGAFQIEKICHSLEDYIAESKNGLPTDALLQSLDWIAHAAKKLSADEHITPPENLLQALAVNEQQGQTPTPVDEPPTPPPEKVLGKTIPIADKDLANDFVMEAQEHLDSSDHHLLILEKDPINKESIAAVFRSVHTIKGVAGFIGLIPICDLAHAAETLLDSIRKGRQTFSGPSVDAIFSAMDVLKTMTASLKNALSADTPFIPPANLTTCITTLENINNGEDTPPQAQTKETIVDSSKTEDIQADASTASSNAAASQIMKVEAARVDLLLDTIGELVIAESIVRGDPEIKAIRSRSIRLEQRLALLNKTTRSLQDMAMSLRLVPIDPVFRKMARLVRDLCRKSGKQVELHIEGGDTEIDKSMVDRLSDPLVHMVRNSIDHGIEIKQTRVENGKPAEGHLTLRAYHKGGSVRIEIEDDGKGLDRDAILQKAIDRQIITAGDTLNNAEIYNLIFESGFSTAQTITEISGRGVGMDVVRREIEALRGSISIESEIGQGTTFTLVLPLTTAIIDGMLLKIAQEIFILPTLSVIESIRPRKEQITKVVAKGEVVSFRDELIPLIRLADVLYVNNAEKDPTNAIIIVVEDNSQKWGFMVDDLLGQQQIVIRSLGAGIGTVQGITGASILADGKPGLILDPSEIVRISSMNAVK